jgi:hypothetical protein
MVLPGRGMVRRVIPDPTGRGDDCATLLGESHAARAGTAGRIEYRLRARFAQPTTRGANFVPVAGTVRLRP